MKEQQAERYDHAHNYELIERALTLWVWGQRFLERTPWMDAGHAAAYERAIAMGIEHLRRYETMDELLAAYFVSWPSDDGGGEGRRWVEEARREARDPALSLTVVEDTAYFRRSREMLLEATKDA